MRRLRPRPQVDVGLPGEGAIDVAAKISAHLCMVDRGHSRKTDEADAVSTAEAAMSTTPRDLSNSNTAAQA